jgi:hypothetical protein
MPFSQDRYKHQDWPKKYEVLPNWVEMFPNFHATAWVLETRWGSSVNLVTYEAGPNAMEPSFAKIVFTKNNVPFKQMEKLCASVAEYNNEELQIHGISVSKNYSMGQDGKIRDSTGQFLPNAEMVSCVVDDLYLSYENWRRFPDIESAKVVEKLTFAWNDIISMQNEERSHRIKDEISYIREDIKESQEKIAELERNQNEIYERAADALNVLEEHGFDMKKIEEIQESESDIFPNGEETSLLGKLARGLNIPLKSISSSGTYRRAP